jgi:hypothetical protein
MAACAGRRDSMMPAEPGQQGGQWGSHPLLVRKSSVGESSPLHEEDSSVSYPSVCCVNSWYGVCHLKKCSML